MGTCLKGNNGLERYRASVDVTLAQKETVHMTSQIVVLEGDRLGPMVRKETSVVCEFWHSWARSWTLWGSTAARNR